MRKIKLLLDEDVHSVLSSILRKRGFDSIHVQEIERKGRSDEEQLALACRQKRCLFTFNVKDFVLLHNHYVKQGTNHWGIIVSKQLPLSLTLRRLLSALQTKSHESMKNRIHFLSHIK